MNGSSHWEDERGGRVGLDQEQLEKITMTETHGREQTNGYQGEGWGGREFGADINTPLYVKWVTIKDLLYTQGTLLSIT